MRALDVHCPSRIDTREAAALAKNPSLPRRFRVAEAAVCSRTLLLSRGQRADQGSDHSRGTTLCPRLSQLFGIRRDRLGSGIPALGRRS